MFPSYQLTLLAGKRPSQSSCGWWRHLPSLLLSSGISSSPGVCFLWCFVSSMPSERRSCNYFWIIRFLTMIMNDLLFDVQTKVCKFIKFQNILVKFPNMYHDLCIVYTILSMWYFFVCGDSTNFTE